MISKQNALCTGGTPDLSNELVITVKAVPGATITPVSPVRFVQAYAYALYVDGKQIDTKQMVVSE